MKYYLFKALHPELAEQELIDSGLQDLYQIQDDLSGELLIGGRAAKKPTQLQYCELVDERKSTVDWEEQWSLFAENFQDGKANIDLGRFGGHSTLHLLPGPGFGDLSHPTTHLMLEMMKNRVQNESVLDIGTGSGILALSALLLGASSSIGLDIDEEALEHARSNAKLNHLKARFLKSLPGSTPPSICLINMILPEQKIALKAISRFNRRAKLWIASGLLSEQKPEYLALTKSWGWQVEQEYQKGDWLGWIFRTADPNRLDPKGRDLG